MRVYHDHSRETEILRGNTEIDEDHSNRASATDPRTAATNAVWIVYGIFEILFGIRILLKLVGADPTGGFVNMVYSLTNPLVAPFRGFFSGPATQGDMTTSALEMPTIVAMLVYTLLVWGMANLITLYHQEEL